MQMKKIAYLFFGVLPLLLAAPGCGDNSLSRQSANGRLVVAAGLPPVAWIAEKIGGDKIEVIQLLPDGRSPHDYAPGAREIGKAAAAKLFLSTGTSFDHLAAKAFPGEGRVLDLAAKAEKLPLTDGCGEHHHHHHDADHHHHDDGEGHDPHIWLSLRNDIIMAGTIRDALAKLDPANAEFYRANCAKLTAEFAALESELKTALKPYAGKVFFVYHPAFGYFAAMTGLKQVGIELGGREASAARLAEVVRHALEERAGAIFVQPQFNPTSAAALARMTGAAVAELDPLARDIPANLRRLSDTLIRGFSAKGAAK